MKKYLSKQSGLTLIEILLTLVIISIITGLAFGVVMNSIDNNERSQAYNTLRQEANLIMAQLRSEHQEQIGKTYSICYDELIGNNNIHFVMLTLNNLPVNEGDCVEISRSSHLPIYFKIQNDKNHEFELTSIIEGKKVSDELQLTIEKDEQKDFTDFVREHNIFVYGNNIRIDGSSTIKGKDSTVVARQNFSSGSASINYIEAQNIYMNGNVHMPNFALGNPSGPISNVYIDGNVKIDGGSVTRPRIHGNLKHTGNLDIISYLNKSIITGNIEKVPTIVFPEADIPPFREGLWYRERGYTSIPILQNNMKYFGPTLTFADWGNKYFNHVIIASSGDINLSGNVHVTGVLFAPNGKVEVQGSSTFRGVIIADSVTVTGNAHVQFEMLVEESEFPF